MHSGETFTGFLALAGRLAVPCLLTFVFFILNVVSLSHGFLGTVRAPFFLMAVYYWSVFRPALMPPWLAFAAGIVLDLLCGLPVGMNAAVFLLTRWSIANQRKFLMAQPFVMTWSIFAAVAAMAALLQWALFGLVNWGWTPLAPVGASLALGIALFPLAAALLHLAHRVLPVGGGFGS